MAFNFKKLLEGMIQVSASDLHLKADASPMLRLHGNLHPIEHPPLTADDTETANDFMIPDKCREELERNGTVDYSFGLTMTERFRVNCYHQRGTKSLAIRRIDSRKVTLADLNLPEQLTRMTELHRGLMLVTGITGSGKSSTLSALINIINGKRRDHIITIEDPIEFVYADEKSVVDQIEIGQDVVDFDCALRHALRQDPDIILIGELRDRTTIETSMHCVDTGHLVFSTLHTPDARQTVTRISHYFSHDEQELIFDQLSKNLQAVVCQRLMRTVGGKGRVPCCEIMFNTPIVRKLIAERRVEEIQQVLSNGEEGMQSFDMHLVQLVKSEIVTNEEAMTVTEDEAAFRRLLQGRSSGSDRGGLIG